MRKSRIKQINRKLGTYVPKKVKTYPSYLIPNRFTYKYTGIVTEEVIEQMLEDMVPTESPIMFGAYCRERGFTGFTADTDLCGDPECGICTDIKKAMKETLKDKYDGTN